MSVMLTHWKSGLAAVAATLAAVALITLDITDESIRRWWAGHALTTDTVAGLLVLLITVLVVDQVLRLRRVLDRSRAVAAQSAVVVVQAGRSAKAVSSALEGSGDHDDARDEVRTYLMMVLISAPLLIDAKASRAFLEQAQYLGGQMGRSLARLVRGRDASSAQLDEAVSRLRAASVPLTRVLRPEERTAAEGGS